MAAANATALYGANIIAPGYLKSGIVAPGLLNTVVAPVHHALPAPIAVPTTYATKAVIAAPATVATKHIYAAPVAYAPFAKHVIPVPAHIAKPVIAVPAHITKPVFAVPAPIATYKTVIGATSLLTGTPLVYGNGIIGAPGYVSHLGDGLLAGPGVVKTILK